MTIRELLEVLKSYPDGVEVVGEWDNGWSKIDSISLSKDRKGNDVVALDVSDYNSYKE